ncbi:hemerythrin domain-containing protein [Phenylobacterium sp. J426]|uniref:hemerythrin domain-containing protein n=1 Tax=Phenylobacterium sp. J426 TaxID=2898439 RepID=UPI0021513873|nr:hemerythrin domain-containing protein [Phenylobacterium sp. J426]MCR5875302.1 hemerythrin domain-containing protein [Phenylobacterium sp. J426]
MAAGTQSQSSKRKASSKSKSNPGITKTGKASMQPDDGVSDLMRDHRKVEELFKQYEATEDDGGKEKLVAQISLELKIHMQLEEEVFYPASRDFVDEQDTVNEAIVEHQSAKDLMAELAGMKPSDEFYDAKVKVLQEMIEHHVGEEEEEYFPEVRRSEMDLKAVGEQMASLRESLMGEMGARPN